MLPCNLIIKQFIPLNKSDTSGRIVFKNKLYLNFSDNIPIYQKKYINTENYVRGYETNPELNPIEIRDRLQWNNLISSTLQLELPLFAKKKVFTELLFFIDYGIGSNKYNDFKLKNKLRGYGFGLRYNIKRVGEVDCYIALNPYGNKSFHTAVNFLYF